MVRFEEIVLGAIDRIYLIIDKLGEGSKIKVRAYDGKIINRCSEEKPARKFSETKISLSLHNSSKKDINIGRILIEYPKESKLSPMYDYESEEDIKRYISPLKGFLLPANKTSHLTLNYINNAFDEPAQYIDCRLKIYTNDYRVMKTLRIKLNAVSS